MIKPEDGGEDGLKGLGYAYLENARERKIKATIHTMEGHHQCASPVADAGKIYKGIPFGYK